MSLLLEVRAPEPPYIVAEHLYPHRICKQCYIQNTGTADSPSGVEISTGSDPSGPTKLATDPCPLCGVQSGVEYLLEHSMLSKSPHPQPMHGSSPPSLLLNMAEVLNLLNAKWTPEFLKVNVSLDADIMTDILTGEPFREGMAEKVLAKTKPPGPPGNCLVDMRTIRTCQEILLQMIRVGSLHVNLNSWTNHQYRSPLPSFTRTWQTSYLYSEDPSPEAFLADRLHARVSDLLVSNTLVKSKDSAGVITVSADRRWRKTMVDTMTDYPRGRRSNSPKAPDPFFSGGVMSLIRHPGGPRSDNLPRNP